MSSREFRQSVPPRDAPQWPVRGRAATDRELVAELKRRQYTTLLEHSPDAIVVVDAQGRVCEWNPAAEAMFGPPRDAVIDVAVREILPAGRRSEFDRAWTGLIGGRPGLPPTTHDWDSEGAPSPVRMLITSIQADGDFAGAVAILRDASADDRSPRHTSAATPPLARDRRTALLGQPSWGTSPDALIGLPNRQDLQDRLAEQVPDGCFRGVAALDIDALASVNEAYGPDVFHDVLQDLSQRLAALPTAAYLGRWRPEVFVWVVDTQDAVVNLNDLAGSIMESLHEPFQVGADRLRFTPSMGLASSETVHVADLLPAALGALRAAKEAGRDRVAWYSDDVPTGPTGAVRLDADLHHGIENGELRLHYQPIIDLAADSVDGVEALVRWERPGVGLLSPASFIEVAERTGQIIPLGAWVARTACKAAVALKPTDEAPFSVSINVSGRQLGDPGILEMLDSALRDAACAPESLIVEITETALMDDVAAAAATLDAIKAMGVRLDLDDFGTGYSSLLYLKHFPVDRIKIDRSFVTGLGTNLEDTAIVASTIALAHAVGIRAVAEGVETAAQLAMLRHMGCDYAQGYLFGRPADAETFSRWRAERKTRAPAGPRTVAKGPKAQAEPRDSLSDDRDDAADGRDDAADQRDEAADRRDAVADLRDHAADLRDDAAADRDVAAQGRDATRRERSEQKLTEAAGHETDRGPTPRAT